MLPRVINKAIRLPTIYTVEKWTHSKCYTKLHVFKPGTEVGDWCYCKRRRYKATEIARQFIEGRYGGYNFRRRGVVTG